MNRPVARNSIGGFTLVEILVGLTLGLIAIVVMLQVFAVFESQKRSTTTGSDAQTTGLLSLYSLEREVRMAGYGLVYNNPINDTTYQGQMACSWMRYASGGTARLDRVLPVLIEDNAGANGSDRITVMLATTPFAGAPSTLAQDYKVTEEMFARNAPMNDAAANAVFAQDDLMLLAAPQRVNATMTMTAPDETANPEHICTLLRVTQAPAPSGSDVTLGTPVLAAATPLPNRPGNVAPPAAFTTTGNATPSYTYSAAASAPSVLLKLGSTAAPFVRNHYFINDARELQVQNLATANPAISIGDNVVDMQAQYGLVAATCENDPATCNVVSTWVNATGATWATPSVANATRIKAIRVSVITRSSQRERDPATNNCLPFDGTNTVPNNATKCRAWANDANAPELPWTGTTDWNDNGRFFRYRTYETIVPLRNMLWGNT